MGLSGALIAGVIGGSGAVPTIPMPPDLPGGGGGEPPIPRPPKDLERGHDDVIGRPIRPVPLPPPDWPSRPPVPIEPSTVYDPALNAVLW